MPRVERIYSILSNAYCQPNEMVEAAWIHAEFEDSTDLPVVTGTAGSGGSPAGEGGGSVAVVGVVVALLSEVVLSEVVEAALVDVEVGCSVEVRAAFPMEVEQRPWRCCCCLPLRPWCCWAKSAVVAVAAIVAVVAVAAVAAVVVVVAVVTPANAALLRG